MNISSFQIKHKGKELSPELNRAVEAVTVEEEINLPAMFAIKLGAFNYKKSNWQGINMETFRPGDAIEILMGMDENKSMLSGEITSLELKLADYSHLEIRGYDKLHRLRFGSRSRVFEKQKDSGIASLIAGDHGLKPAVEDTGSIHPYVLQNNQSDYEFLMQRAALIDYEVYVSGGELHFAKSRTQKKAELTLVYKKDFEELTLDLRTLTKGSKVEVRGWNEKAKEIIAVTAGVSDETGKDKMGGRESGFELAKAFGESAVTIPDAAPLDSGEAEKIAKAVHGRLLREFITGEVKGAGNPKLRAGKTVNLKIGKMGSGSDERFSGLYYIVSTVHTIDGNGYNTTLKVKRSGI